MIPTLVDLLIEQKKRNEKYFLNYQRYAKSIKEIVTESGLQDARVLVFGSTFRGTWVPNKSDIDILVVSDKVSKSSRWQNELKIRILKELGDLGAPFEIHFATPAIYSEWFRKFIANDYEEV
jgi:predicted nucleotidyltransferase